jgi:hypothetical protein
MSHLIAKLIEKVFFDLADSEHCIRVLAGAKTSPNIGAIVLDAVEKGGHAGVVRLECRQTALSAELELPFSQFSIEYDTHPNNCGWCWI